MKNIIKSKAGYTLMELLIVIGIIAVISVIAIPVCSGVMETGKKQSDKIDANIYSQTVKALLNVDPTAVQNMLVIDEDTPDYEVILATSNLKSAIRNQYHNASFEAKQRNKVFYYSPWSQTVILDKENATVEDLNKQMEGTIDIAGRELNQSTIWINLKTNKTVK